MPLISVCFTLLISVVVFHFCYQLGRRSRLETIRKCPEYSKQDSIEPLTPCELCDGYGVSAEDNPLVINYFKATEDDNLLTRAFNDIHHPSESSKIEIIFSRNEKISKFEDCNSFYLTRTGSRTAMSNKCVAIATVPGGASMYHSPWYHSHRIGISANLTDQYQRDYGETKDFEDEENILPLMMRDLDKLVEEFRTMMGDPVLPDGTRKAVIIMVANEGVMDLVLNFICSMKYANIDLGSVVVFVGQPEYIPLIENMGGKAMHSPAFGPIPQRAAGGYGDKIFSRLMWLKTTSVYIASKAGYDIIFQDADLVWIQDPIPHLRAQKWDIAFMDDGARTTRFTPFFVNSGFYYQKNNPRTRYLMEKMLKTVAEISATHSHQATLIRHITESHHLYGLQVGVINEEMFPAGIMYHHNKKYVKRVIEKTTVPFVWHMCWTSSREEKVYYFKNMGMWFLPEDDQTCIASSEMLSFVTTGDNSGAAKATPGAVADRLIKDKCCRPGGYYLGNSSETPEAKAALSRDAFLPGVTGKKAYQKRMPFPRY